MRFAQELASILERMPAKFWVAVYIGPIFASLGLFFAGKVIQPLVASNLLSEIVAVHQSSIVAQIEVISLITWTASWVAAARIFFKTRRQLLGI